MIERYCAEEVIEACQDYLREEDRCALGLPVTCHKGRLAGKGSKGRKTFIDKEYTQVEEAHSCVLQYLTMMEPFIEKHNALIRAENPWRSEQWIVREQKHLFGKWLREQDILEGEIAMEQTSWRLAVGRSSQVTSWQTYDVNGYTFYTKVKDQKSVPPNSGVRIENVDAFGEVHTHYGLIEDIWELEYGSNIQMTLFRCQWVKQPGGVEVDKFGLTCQPRQCRLQGSHVGAY